MPKPVVQVIARHQQPDRSAGLARLQAKRLPRDGQLDGVAVVADVRGMVKLAVPALFPVPGVEDIVVRGDDELVLLLALMLGIQNHLD